MCTGYQMAMIGLAAIGVGKSLSMSSPKVPDLPPLPTSKVTQAKKQADKSTADAIKSARKKGGIAKPPTLLAGAGGIGDEELNLGEKRLV